MNSHSEHSEGNLDETLAYSNLTEVDEESTLFAEGSGMSTMLDQAEANLAATKTLAIGNSTDTITLNEDSQPQARAGLGRALTPQQVRERERLIENYEQLQQDLAVYYPVAYGFEEEIGRGRQGIVYKANRQGGRGCRTRHAIKVFDPGIYRTPALYWTDMGRIASQISVMQTLRSPNLVSMETYDEVNGVGYLQMELINGVDLRYLLTGKRMDQVKQTSDPEEWDLMYNSIFREVEGHGIAIQPGIAIYIMRMILKGLETLHNAGFIHSDVKPSNAMIDQFGYVKVIDYGRAVKPNEKVNILLGSPLYMAPENHRREPATEQSDIYGVGMVGLELLRGKQLVDARSMTEEDLYKFKMDLPNFLEDLLPDYVRENQEFIRVIRKFIDPDPEKRYANVIAAETEQEGLRIVHRQLTSMGQDIDYARVMGMYMSRLCAIRRGDIPMP